MAQIPSWPATLTNRDWQKKKGTIAKIVGKTGVGEAMDAAEKAYKKIDPKVLLINWAIPKPSERTGDKLADKQQLATAHRDRVVAKAHDELDDLYKLATAVAAKWRKNSTPPASRKHAELVADEAQRMRDALSKAPASAVSQVMAEWDALDAEDQKKKQIRDREARKQVDDATKLLKDSLVLARKTPTVAAWTGNTTKGMQSVRSVCNVVYSIESLRAVYWKTWEPLSKTDWLDKCPSDEDEAAAYLTKRFDGIAKRLKEFEAGYARHL